MNSPVSADDQALARQALSLPAAQRASWLADLRQRDPDCFQRVSVLLRQVDAETEGAELPSAAAASVPRQIGPFAILATLGEGGMGTVYLARQQHPSREVALKVIRGAGGSREALARFHREAETLARLEHPGIARVYEAGTVEAPGGELPWLAMEYVRGEDLATHARSLSQPQKLQLLIELARAVHFAHGRGVIHRDLKPANILVDNDGHPRILDFGVARLQDEGTSMTMAGQVLGTVPYMSPEQLAGDARAADVPSDVYALGVIAYEILSGAMPYPTISNASLLEAIDCVRREQPVPLVRVSPELRGDIDTVVMKALSHQASQRYVSAQAFADDLDNILQRRPIAARPPTWGYIALRFSQRNRALVVAAGSVMMVLIAATVVSANFALSEAGARKLAEQRAAEAQAANTFLTDMLSQARPENALGRELSVREMVDEAAATVDRFDQNPRVQALVQRTLAQTYGTLGEYRQSVDRQRLALQLLEQTDIDPVERWQWEYDLFAHLVAAGDLDEASSLADRLEPLVHTPGQRAFLLVSRARLAEDQGQREQAIEHLTALLALIDQGLDPDSETVQTARLNLSGLLRDRGDLEQADQLLEALLANREATFGRVHPRTLSVMHNLAALRVDQGRLDEAEALYMETMEQRRKILGIDNVQTLSTMQGYGRMLVLSERAGQALPILRDVADTMERLFGLQNADTQVSVDSYAYALGEAGAVDEALEVYRSLLAVQREAGQQRTAPHLVLLNNLGMLELGAGRPQRAEGYLREAADLAEELVGREHLYWLIFAGNLGEALLDQQRFDEARALLQPSHDGLAGTFPEGHERRQRAEQRLARLPAIESP